MHHSQLLSAIALLLLFPLVTTASPLQAGDLASLRLAQLKDRLKAQAMVVNPPALSLAYDILYGEMYKRELEKAGMEAKPSLIWTFLDANERTRAFTVEIAKFLVSDESRLADIWLESSETVSLEDFIGGLKARLRSHDVLLLSNFDGLLEEMPGYTIEQVVQAMRDHLPPTKTILIIDNGPALERFKEPRDPSAVGINFVAAGHGYMLSTVQCTSRLIN